MPSGNPDKVTCKIITDPVAAYQQVVSDKSDYDFQVVPNDRLPEAQSKYGDRLKFYTSPNTYYYFLNNSAAVQQPEGAAGGQLRNRPQRDISGVYGGLGRPTQNFLPPDYPQYKKLSAYTFDIAKAKQLVQQSGTTGASVDVWTGTNEDPSKAATEYLASQLSKIGYKPKLHLLSHPVYFTTIGTRRRRPRRASPTGTRTTRTRSTGSTCS